MNCRDASGSVQCKVDRLREMGQGEPDISSSGDGRVMCHVTMRWMIDAQVYQQKRETCH